MTVLRHIYRWVTRFLLFWKGYLIGDDWWGAAIVLAGLGLTYLAVRLQVQAFWIPLVFVPASLGQNLWRARRRAARANAAARRPDTARPSTGSGQ